MANITDELQSPWGTRDTRAAEREQKREAVIRAAAQAFAENGYNRTSLADVAEMLGVTKPTIYYYAKSKEDLLAAVLTRARDMTLVELPFDPHAPAVDVLRAFMRVYAQVIMTPYGRCFAAMTAGDLREAEFLHIREGKALVDQKLCDLLEAAVADGSIAPCNIHFTAFAIAGALNGIATWYYAEGELDPSSIAEILINQLMVGLLPRKS